MCVCVCKRECVAWMVGGGSHGNMFLVLGHNAITVD